MFEARGPALLLATVLAGGAEERGFESTLAGGLKLYHVPGADEPGADEELQVVLRLDRGLAHAALSGQEALAGAAFAACTAAPEGDAGWQGRLESLAVEFTGQSSPDGLEVCLRALAMPLSGELAEDVVLDVDERTREPGWERFRETAFPVHPVGTARLGGEAPPERDAVVAFLQQQWGPEGGALVVIGGEFAGVHRAATRAFAGWGRALRPPARFEANAAPTRARQVPEPSGAGGWMGYRLDPGLALEDRLCCEGLLASIADTWPRRVHARSGILLGVPAGSEPMIRLERLRVEIEQGRARPGALREALGVRIEHLRTDRREAARSCAASAVEEGDPWARGERLRALLDEDDETFERRLRRLSTWMPAHRRIVVTGAG